MVKNYFEKHISRFIAFFSILCIVQNSFAQSVSSYVPSRNTGLAYSSISVTGSAFDSWRNTTSYTQDDNRSDFTDIGFDFWYNGVRYTQFSISTNGFLDFSSSNDDGGPIGDAFGFDNNAFTASTASGNSTSPAITPFYDDLMAQGGTAALGNSMKYLLTGAAPNRTLTVEWINMAVFTNTTPSLNFQVKLIESTGVIIINYGTMNTGTYTFSYSMGLNGQTISNTPTLAQLKALQLVNLVTFNNTPRNTLATMPASNSQYIFTPPVPTATAGAVSFTGVGQTGMTVNWPNWASNEVGYVIYNSTDNINFNFVTQTAVNATSSAITGLSPGTTYYWKVYAVTEGCLSSSLNGTQATLAAGNKISANTGMWNTAATWSPTGVPVASDNVTIANGHTVTVNTDAVCNNLTVGQGASGVLTIGNNNTSRNIILSGNLTINTGGNFNANTGSNNTHAITFPGNITNNGILNFATDANSFCDATFNKNGNQTISGTGATTTFNNIIVNKGTSISNILDIQTPSFVVPSNFLTLTNGTFKLSTTGASNIVPFTTAATIPQKAGLWLNSAVSTISVQATLTMYGNVTVSSGIFYTGNAADEDLLSNGGFLTVSGGTLNIASKYYAIGINNLSKFTIAGGSVIVPSIGSTNTTIAPFQIAGAGSQFNMSGGSLIIPREGGTGAQNLGFVNIGSSGGSVTGGTLQIGSTSSPAAQIIQINSNFPIGNLAVSSASVNATLLTNSLSIISNVNINTGTLTANSFDLSLGKNWVNSGGVFVPGTGMVLFNGTTAQTIFKAGGETFNHIAFSNAGNKTLLSPITTNTLTINSGTFTANTFSTSVLGNWVNNGGTFAPGTATVFFSGTTAQSIFKSGGETFNNITFSNAGIKTLLSNITTNTLTITSGTLAGSSFGMFVNGNWVNNGGILSPGTGTVTMNGTVAQTIFKSGGETFNTIAFNNNGAKTLLSNITATNVVINTSSNLDVTATNYTVAVKTLFSNSGTFTARKGVVLFNGITAATIGGSTTTDFWDVTLNNTAGVSLAHAENLVNTLTLTNGTFSTSAQPFTMISTSSNTARIAAIAATANIIGNVIVQRYAPGGYTGWALLGTPISSALTLQDWDDDIYISCPTCPDGSAAGFRSIYTYNEAAVGSYSSAASYIPLTSITNPITPNKGYWVYLGTGSSSTAPITLDVTGSVRKFSNSIPLTRTNTGSVPNDGWNLIHNPFPSPIKWSLLKGATANIDNAIYSYNADLNGGAGGSAAYVNGISSPALGAGGISDTIPMCQGFYVHCTANTTLTAVEANKVSGNPTFLKMNNTGSLSSPQELLRLYVKGSNLHNDETVLYLQNGATDGFDAEYDAIKMAGQDPSAPSIVLEDDSVEYQINAIAPITSNFSMRVKTLTGITGTYTVGITDYNNFPSGACISLYDTITGITTDLRAGNYVFTLNASLTKARFRLNITLNPLDVTTNIAQPLCDDPDAGMITAVGNNAGPWNYYWKDINGTLLRVKLNRLVADTLQGLSDGDYYVEVNTVGSCDNNTTLFSINAVTIPDAQFTSVDTVDLMLGGSIDFLNTSLNGSSYSWDFGDNTGVSTLESPTYYYSSVGVYTVSLITTSMEGCSDTIVKEIVVTNAATGIMSYSEGSSLVLKTLGDNEFTLHGNVKGNGVLNIKLHDVLGKLIIDYGNYNSDDINLPVNLQGYKAGIYFLDITGDNMRQTIKLPVK